VNNLLRGHSGRPVLLLTRGGCRIDGCRAPGGQETGKQRDHRQDHDVIREPALSEQWVTVVYRQKFYENAFASQQALAHESGIALRAGLEDADLIKVMFPDPRFLALGDSLCRKLRRVLATVSKAGRAIPAR